MTVLAPALALLALMQPPLVKSPLSARPPSSGQHQLIGFGLVVGLDGTGSQSTFTRQVAADIADRLGMSGSRVQEVADRRLNDRLGPCRRTDLDRLRAGVRQAGVLRPGNCSAVMVLAEVTKETPKGGRLDVVVSSMDDAESLKGGRLLLTQLKGVDGQVYAVAQGPVAVEQTGRENTARVPNGARVEREVR